MSERLTTEAVAREWQQRARLCRTRSGPHSYCPDSVEAFEEWLNEVRAEAVDEVIDALVAIQDGGRRGVAEHSKSGAAAAEQRHALRQARKILDRYRK